MELKNTKSAPHLHQFLLAHDPAIQRSKNHVAKSKFHKDVQPRHQKGRRIPINLEEKVNNELKKLSDEKHIIKLSSCPDKYFISK